MDENWCCPTCREESLQRVEGLGLVVALVAVFTIEVCGQKSSTARKTTPLVLPGAAPMPNAHRSLWFGSRIRRSSRFHCVREMYVQKNHYKYFTRNIL